MPNEACTMAYKMMSAENARVVASNKENLVTLQVEVAVEHIDEMFCEPQGR